MSERWSDGLMEAGFADPVLADVFGWPARVRRMVEVEAALGRALANAGVIPSEAADDIARACNTDRLDLDALAARAATAATPVIPLLDALAAGAGELASSWLHHGATSQDVIDTAVVLQLRDAIDHLESRLLVIGNHCAQLAQRHRGSVMAGRTLGQHAVPITFGLKAARWLGALDRRVEQLRWVRPRVLQVQLGGAAGTLAAYQDRAADVVRFLADELDLTVPDLPWHAERDRIVEFAGVLAGITATVSAVAGDLVALASSDVAEAREAPGDTPSSSAMPHKRNPVNATAARAAGRLALGETQILTSSGAEHEHERSAGSWQTEWVALPAAVVRTGGALERLTKAIETLVVDVDRARENLDAALGLPASEALAAALTPALGRDRAQQLVRDLVTEATSERVGLRDIARSTSAVMDVLPDHDLERVFAAETTVQLTSPLIDRALATHDRILQEGAG